MKQTNNSMLLTLFLIIFSSPKTRNQNIANFKYFPSYSAFTFPFIKHGCHYFHTCLKRFGSNSRLIDKQLYCNVLTAKKSIHAHKINTKKHQNNKPYLELRGHISNHHNEV